MPEFVRVGLVHGGLLLATALSATYSQNGRFAAALLAILMAHEMGHYCTARAYGVQQSLPYFIPAPSIFGTLGALILLRSQPPHRRALLHLALAGPYAGLLVALPLLTYGLAHSAADNLAFAGPQMVLGRSLLFEGLCRAWGLGSGPLLLHPCALAGWAGLLITSLNLIPAAQLDGGHVLFCLAGRWHARIGAAVALGLGALGAHYAWQGASTGELSGSMWGLWGLLLWVLGLRHPSVGDPEQPLPRGAYLHGLLALAIFVLTFVPVPVHQLPG